MHDINDMSILSRIWRFHSLRNTTYLERRNPECIILGRESYWSLDNQHVIYWSSQAVLTRSRWVGICCGLMEVCEPRGWLLLIWSWESVPREMHGIGHSESQSRYWYCLFVWLDVQYHPQCFCASTTYQPETIFCFWQRILAGKTLERLPCGGCATDLHQGFARVHRCARADASAVTVPTTGLVRMEWQKLGEAACMHKCWKRLSYSHTLHGIYVGNYLYDRCIYIYTPFFQCTYWWFDHRSCWTVFCRQGWQMLRVCDNDSNSFWRVWTFPSSPPHCHLPQDSHLWGHKLRSCDRSAADRGTQRFLVPRMSGANFCPAWALFVDRHSFPVHRSPCQQLFASSLDFEAGRSQHKLRREKTPGRLAARICEAAWMF